MLGLGLAVAGFVGRSYVKDQLADRADRRHAGHDADATSAAIKEAGLTGVTAPSCTVAGEKVDTGMEAKCFADYMRVHTLEATGGKTYSQMPQYATDDGKGTNDAAAAAKARTARRVSNAARKIWVTETALTTALNVSFFAEGVALLAIVVGIALLLVGIGFVLISASSRRRGATAPGEPSPQPAPAA